MTGLTLVNHASGAPGLRLCGFGTNLWPEQGIIKLKCLMNENTLWAKDRSISDLKKMLSNSQVVVSVWNNKRLIGFGRATSDAIYRGILWDVVVDRQYQNQGIGNKIIRNILNNPRMLNVERIYLMTTNCKDFYLKMGFQKENDQSLLILKQKPLT